MIKAKFSQGKTDILLTVSGHSGKRGESLVCAGVSTLVFALERTLKESEFTYDKVISDGLIQLVSGKDALPFFEVVLNGLMLLAEYYPDEVKLKM